MKTKMYKLIFLIPALMLGIASCDYLDVVPDEKPTDKDAFADPNAARKYVYSCYSYLPNPREGATSLDLMTGDEVITPFEHESFAKFSFGQFTASSPVISYWNTLFQGIRQCYILLNNVDDVRNLSVEAKEDYKAQAHFLIAYYHFLQMRCYGGCIIVRSLPDLSTPKEEFLGRNTFEECVAFVCEEFDKAAAVLPPRRSTAAEYGLATSIAAKALKAKLLLYVASPLFNGGGDGEESSTFRSYLSSFKDQNGVQLMPTTYDPQKWKTAKDALKEAIDAAEQAAAGYNLDENATVEGSNPHPKNSKDRLMRYVPMKSHNELIWADCRKDNTYGVAVKSLPYAGNTWNGVAPTLEMLKRFYTEKGLPVEEDPDFYPEADWWKLEDPNAPYDANRDSSRFSAERTMLFNTKREPRYYAWVAFQGGFFEVLNAPTNGGYTDDKSYQTWGPGRLVCNFLLKGNVSRQPDTSRATYRNGDYSPSGFLNKKFVNPQLVVGSSLNLIQHPWPILRLADLYLMYAEACVEVGDLEEAKIYLNKVRTRAGVPEVDVSWQNTKSGRTASTKEVLREIVRRERQVELYLENQNFWDMRRWLLAAKYFDATPEGMNIDGTKLVPNGGGDDRDAFNRVIKAVVGGIHHFTSPTHYFLPIPIEDVNRNPNMTQNPGY